MINENTILDLIGRNTELIKEDININDKKLSEIVSLSSFRYWWSWINRAGSC